MSKKLDLTGKRFGRLVALEFAIRENGNTKWLCRCDCGNLTTVQLGSLTGGATMSCGCLNREISTRHGLSLHNRYASHNIMMQRCYNPKAPGYKNYGARGFVVCERWHDIRNYNDDIEKHLGPKPTPEYTLDRIDNDGNYKMSNMRWATKTEQSSNQRAKTNTGEKYIVERNNRFYIRPKINGKYKRISFCNSLTEAIKARDRAIENTC